MPAQLIQLMQQFNFKRSVALVYVRLLTDGPLAKPELLKATRQAPPHVDQALQQLLCLRLIGTDHQRGRSLYYATEPALAWLALVADLVWSTGAALGPIRNLPQTEDPQVENLRLICTEVSALAQRLYKPQAAALGHKERDAESREEFAQLICESIGQAQQRILAVSKSPRLPQVSSFWAVLTRQIEAGAHYQRVVDLDEVTDHGLTIVSRDMEAYNIDLRVLEQARIRQKFYIVDNKFLAVFHQPGAVAGEARKGVGRLTTQGQIITRYRKRFEQYSASAIPGRFVVAHMRAAAARLLSQARASLLPIEVLWLEDLIEYGKFSKFEEWSKERLAHAEQRATAAGVVRHNTDGDIVPLYPTDESTLRAAYAAVPLT